MVTDNENLPSKASAENNSNSNDDQSGGKKSTYHGENEWRSLVTIFFKVRESVKKSVYTGGSMSQLKELFFEKFDSFNNKGI